MLQRLAAPLLFLIALLALPASAHAAGQVVPSTASGTTAVPAGAAQTLQVSCPAPSVALHGAVTRMGSGVTLRRSGPGEDAGDWTFQLAGGPGGGRAEAQVRCVRLGLPEGVTGVSIRVGMRSRFNIRIAPGETESRDIACPRAQVATGYGLIRGSRGDVRVASAVPSAGGWSFVLENVGDRTARAGMSAQCLKEEVAARRHGERVALRFRVARRAFEDIVVSGGQVEFLHACRRGQFSVSAGSEVEPLDAIALVESNATRRRGASWTFAGASAGDAVTTHLVCLGLGSRFS